MFEDLPSKNGNAETKEIPEKQEQKDNSQRVINTGWDRFWDRVTSLGLGDIALRTGTALVTIGLIGLVVWVMKDNFVAEEMTSNTA